MEKESLTLFKREEVGKNAVKKIFKMGMTPAVIYGHNKPTIPVKVDFKEVGKILKHRGKAVYYEVENGDKELIGKKLIIKEIAKDPVKDIVKHIDFYEMSEKEMTRFTVPLKLVGKPEGLVMGGILEWEKREVEVKAFPQDVPDLIEVDISNLKIGDAIHLADIKLPPNVHLAESEKIVVVTLLAPKEEVELTPEEKEAMLQASLAGEEKEEQ